MTHQIFSPPRSKLALRLRLDPKTGYADGSWWPWSNDLSIELPQLLTQLSIDLGPIDRVTYRLGEWAPTSSRILFLNRLVHLGWSLLQPANTISVRGATGVHLTLLIVASSSESPFEQNTIADEATLGNAEIIAQLAPSDITGLTRWIDTFEAENQWDSDGGAQLAPVSRRARRTS